MATPVVMIVGRTGPEDVGFRGGSYRAGVRYLDAISRAGGAGVIAPPVAGAVQQTVALLDRVDAVVLHGGGDIDPACYGQPPSAELYGVAAVHDEVELAVCVEALRRDLPVLAICRGLQVVDVALGGTLRQHIGEDHRMRHHDVTVVGGLIDEDVPLVLQAQAPPPPLAVEAPAPIALGASTTDAEASIVPVSETK